MADRSAEATFYEGQRRRIPLARVPTPEELLNVDQFVARQTFAEAILPTDARVQVPVTPWRLQKTPLKRAGRVSALNEHGPLPDRIQTTAAGDQLPLQGIRIIDLSMGWAGPLAARHLGRSTIKYEAVAGKGANQIGFEQVAIDIATEYSAEDSEVTLQLHQILWPQI